MPDYPNLLVTDFDGTITDHDFYELALERVDRRRMPDYWGQYAGGRISHFEAMKGIFSHIRCGAEAMAKIVGGLRPDPELAAAIARLRRAGWDVAVVSAGSSWYIRQVLEEAGAGDVAVHASPGRFTPERGLELELPLDSPYCSAGLGIDKEAAVRDALRRYRRVAFAGNGPPDLAPALLVPPELRFARAWLARELARRGEGHVGLGRWSEVTGVLTGGV